MQITDGKGTGYAARVDSEGNIKSACIDTPLLHHVAHGHGEAYIANMADTENTLTVTTTGGEMMLVRNDNTTVDMTIDHICVTVSADMVMTAKKNMTIGTIADEADHTPVNLNFGSGNTADATVYTWAETNHGLGGLTAGTVIATRHLEPGTHVINWGAVPLLGYHDNLTIGLKGAGEATVNVAFFFHDQC